MKPVRAKKHLGQHFLKDLNIAKKIADSLTGHKNYSKVLEVGPGMGVLTQYLFDKPWKLQVAEIDKESIEYLEVKYPELKIIAGDFLQLDLKKEVSSPFAIIGNFPYNISSQIFFKALENRDYIPEIVGMVQREVGQRIASGPGNKDYGILSVLLQAFYNIDYLFTVSENVFNPPPKVKSGVIRLRRNEKEKLECNEKLFFSVVKQAFQMRRKTLRNALKVFGMEAVNTEDSIFDKRAEQLSVQDFISLTNHIEKYKK